MSPNNVRAVAKRKRRHRKRTCAKQDRQTVVGDQGKDERGQLSVGDKTKGIETIVVGTNFHIVEGTNLSNTFLCSVMSTVASRLSVGCLL